MQHGLACSSGYNRSTDGTILTIFVIQAPLWHPLTRTGRQRCSGCGPNFWPSGGFTMWVSLFLCNKVNRSDVHTDIR